MFLFFFQIIDPLYPGADPGMDVLIEGSNLQRGVRFEDHLSMFPDFSEKQPPSKSATDTCLVCALSDSTWAKPEVNRAAYDLLL